MVVTAEAGVGLALAAGGFIEQRAVNLGENEVLSAASVEGGGGTVGERKQLSLGEPV